MKLSLILGGLLIVSVAGSAWYIDYQADQISTLKGNQIVLETQIQEQNEAIENHLAKQKQTQNLLVFLEKEKQEAMRDVSRLRKTFAKHDLDELTLAKPELMEGKINRASKRVLENLEKLTDPNQFDEEDSDNS